MAILFTCQSPACEHRDTLIELLGDPASADCVCGAPMEPLESEGENVARLAIGARYPAASGSGVYTILDLDGDGVKVLRTPHPSWAAPCWISMECFAAVADIACTIDPPMPTHSGGSPLRERWQ